MSGSTTTPSSTTAPSSTTTPSSTTAPSSSAGSNLPAAPSSTAASKNKLNIPDDVVSGITSKIAALAASLSDSFVDKMMNPIGSPGYINKQNIYLKKKWTDASNNYRDAPFQLSLAEKNYYEYNDGKPNGNQIYNMTIIDRFANNATELQENSIEKQQEFMADLTQALKQYQGERLFADRTVQLLQIQQKKNADLFNKIDMYNRILQTSERKVVYEINNTTSLHTYRRVMLFFYYSAIVCYIIFSNFIPDKLYVNKTVWLIIIIASLIPIILNLVIKWTFIIGDVLAYWFKTRPYKRVHTTLGDKEENEYESLRTPVNTSSWRALYKGSDNQVIGKDSRNPKI